MFTTGDVNHGVWTAGTVMGLIHDIPTCEVLVKRIEAEAEAAIARLSGLVVPAPKSRL